MRKKHREGGKEEGTECIGREGGGKVWKVKEECTLNSWLCLTVLLRAPIRSSLPHTVRPGSIDTSSSLPLAWSLVYIAREEREESYVGAGEEEEER